MNYATASELGTGTAKLENAGNVYAATACREHLEVMLTGMEVGRAFFLRQVFHAAYYDAKD